MAGYVHWILAAGRRTGDIGACDRAPFARAVLAPAVRPRFAILPPRAIHLARLIVIAVQQISDHHFQLANFAVLIVVLWKTDCQKCLLVSEKPGNGGTADLLYSTASDSSARKRPLGFACA